MIANLQMEQWHTDCEESIIDSEVTFFVDDECMSFSAGKLCMDCFITPLTLIEEIKLNYELQ